MAGLDFFAYARGAEQANRDNWADVLRGLQVGTTNINQRTAEERLRQSQEAYNLAAPIAQANAEDFMAQRTANLESANWEQQLYRQSSAIADPNARTQFLIDQLAQRRQAIDPADPGAQIKGQQLERLALTRLFPSLRAENQTDALPKLLAAVGLTGGQAFQEQAKWTNPETARDEAAIIQAGGRPVRVAAQGRNGVSEIGYIEYAGERYTPEQFAQIQATRRGINGSQTPVWGIGAGEAQRAKEFQALKASVDSINERGGLNGAMLELLPTGQILPRKIEAPVAPVAPVAPQGDATAALLQLQQQATQSQNEVEQLRAQLAALQQPQPGLTAQTAAPPRRSPIEGLAAAFSRWAGNPSAPATAPANPAYSPYASPYANPNPRTR